MNDGLSAVLDMAWRDIEAAQQKQFAAISEAAWAPLRALADMPVGPFVALDGLPRHAWRPKPERPCTKDEMRQFILQQMIEAKDEPAKDACRRYVLRNGLLVVD